jgi:hypothetical protein
MSGQADNFEATQDFTRLEPMIHDSRLVTKNKPTQGFENASHPAPTLKTMAAFQMSPVGKRRMNLTLKDLLKTRGMKGVIEMSVSEIQIADLGKFTTLGFDGPAHTSQASQKSGVDQVNPVIPQDHVVGDEWALKSENFRHRMSVLSFSKKPTMDAFYAGNGVLHFLPTL